MDSAATSVNEKKPGPDALYCTDAEWKNAILFCGQWPERPNTAAPTTFSVSNSDLHNNAVKFELGTDADPLVVQGFATDPAGGGICLVARAPPACTKILSILRARFEKAHTKKYVGKGRRLRKKLTRGTPLTVVGKDYTLVCLRPPHEKDGQLQLRAGDRAVVRVVFGGWAAAGVVTSSYVQIMDVRKV